MSERYTRVSVFSENLYTETSPVVIVKRALLKDNTTGQMVAQIKFRSISSNRIKALKVAIRAFDVSGSEVEGVSEYQYLDLSVPRNAEFGQNNAIVLPDANTRSFECECTQVVFFGGTKWESSGSEWKPLEKQQLLSARLGSLYEQYKLDTTAKADYVVTDDRDLWLCACGEVNHAEDAVCYSCRSRRSHLLDSLDKEKLNEHYNTRKAEQEAKLAKALEKKEAKKAALIATMKKLAPYAVGVLALVIVFLILNATIFIPNGKYKDAKALMNEEKYIDAITAFEALDGFKDSEKQIDTCKDKTYAEATVFMDSNKYCEAYDNFMFLGSYKDSADKANFCYEKICSMKQHPSATVSQYIVANGTYYSNEYGFPSYLNDYLSGSHIIQIDENDKKLSYFVSAKENSSEYSVVIALADYSASTAHTLPNTYSVEFTGFTLSKSDTDDFFKFKMYLEVNGNMFSFSGTAVDDLSTLSFYNDKASVYCDGTTLTFESDEYSYYLRSYIDACKFVLEKMLEDSSLPITFEDFGFVD